jgi:hypothetical protein
MGLQNFVDKSGPVVSAAWLNVVDAIKFTVFGDATTKAAARTNLTSDAPLEIANGGTAARTAAAARVALTTDLPLEVANGGTGGRTLPALIASAGGFGADSTLASAATTNLGSLSTRVITVTGTTTITSFGSSATTANPIFLIKFTGALKITYNATSMILPGAADVTTANGDSAIMEYLGSGNWQMLIYMSAAALLGGKKVTTINTSYVLSTVDVNTILVCNPVANMTVTCPSDATATYPVNGETEIWNSSTTFTVTVNREFGGIGFRANLFSWGNATTPTITLFNNMTTTIRKTSANNWYEMVYTAPRYLDTSATVTLTGVTVVTSTILAVIRESNLVTLTLQGVALTGTSNTTAMTLTGLPTTAIPAQTRRVFTMVTDNGTVKGGWATISTLGVITFGLGIDGATAFTNVGTKGLQQGWTLTYPLNETP